MTQPIDCKRGAFFDLSARVKLRITGADRVRFLNGQITNDLEKARPDLAIHACVLSAKGKIDAEVFVSADPDFFLLDADPELLEDLPARLDRYIIADDVQIEDIKFAMFHVTGPEQPVVAEAWRIVSSERFACRGWDVWTETSNHEAVFQQLSGLRPVCDATCAETFRIEQGVPRWGRELTQEIIPIEANLEARCVDYEKGCYIGQEVISRIKMSGQVNKRLSGLKSVDGKPIRPGMRLATAEGKDAGWVTSAIRSPRLGEIALAFVKRGSNTAGSRLSAVPEGSADKVSVPVQVVEIPFI